MRKKRDHGLENLLHLDGDRYFIDDDGDYEVCFRVKESDVSEVIPHGISYSLVLINKRGERVVGFDNAHPVPSGPGRSRKKTVTNDHKHIGKRTSPYKYKGADKLIEDFWKEVDKVIKKD
jgi:hypothetical protein